jgi:hypothetical protein
LGHYQRSLFMILNWPKRNVKLIFDQCYYQIMLKHARSSSIHYKAFQSIKKCFGQGKLSRKHFWLRIVK